VRAKAAVHSDRKSAAEAGIRDETGSLCRGEQDVTENGNEGRGGACGGWASSDLIELMFTGDPLVTVSDVPDPVRKPHALVRHQANNLENARPRLPILSDIRAVKDLFADGEFGLWHPPEHARIAGQFLDKMQATGMRPAKLGAGAR
jgi:hypothetical protein